MRIATAAEMRAIEEHAVALGVSLETLMENAGRAVFEAVQRRATPPARIAVVCGTGNNGGDGLVVARLAHEAGYEVHTFIAAREGSLKGLPNLQLERLVALGVKPLWLSEPANMKLLRDADQWGVVVDAVLGTGANRQVDGLVKEGIEEVERWSWSTLSIDVPSGLNCDTGETLGAAVSASQTVVLGEAKRYLFQMGGIERAGSWSIADIGIPDECVEISAFAFEKLNVLVRGRASNKGQNGHVLIVAGSRQYRGAATLAALGAVKAGAGLVTVAGIEPVIEAVAAQVPEAILLPLAEENGVIGGAAAEIIAKAAEKVTSAVFGPGLTTNQSVGDCLATVWKGWRIPSVIDADALNLVAQGLELPDTLCFLTPHPGEAARLLGTTIDDVQRDRFATARRLTDRFRNPVLLKGAFSVFGHYEEKALKVNTTGNPGMASAGMGDVLAGVTAALVKQMPHNLTDALWQAALLHGKAGDLAAEEIGGIGYSASDLAHFLPRARSILTT